MPHASEDARRACNLKSKARARKRRQEAGLTSRGRKIEPRQRDAAGRLIAGGASRDGNTWKSDADLDAAAAEWLRRMDYKEEL